MSGGWDLTPPVSQVVIRPDFPTHRSDPHGAAS